MGFFPGKGSMAGRLVIPIHNENGALVAYTGRSIDGSEPRYKLPAGFHKAAILYNLHRAVRAADENPDIGAGAVIVVEGFFDCIKVWQTGFVSVVALMGCSLSEEQEQQLVAHFQRVVVMMDGDEAGRQAAAAVAARLLLLAFVHVVDVPAGKQPDMLSSAEIQALMGLLQVRQ